MNVHNPLLVGGKVELDQHVEYAVFSTAGKSIIGGQTIKALTVYIICLSLLLNFV